MITKYAAIFMTKAIRDIKLSNKIFSGRVQATYLHLCRKTLHSMVSVMSNYHYATERSEELSNPIHESSTKAYR